MVSNRARSLDSLTEQTLHERDKAQRLATVCDIKLEEERVPEMRKLQPMMYCTPKQETATPYRFTFSKPASEHRPPPPELTTGKLSLILQTSIACYYDKTTLMV